MNEQDPREELLNTYRDRLLNLDQLKKIPPPEWLITGYIMRKSIAMAYGPSGVGKTFLILAMALCVATGAPFLGTRPVKKGRVLYVVGEGVNGMMPRIQAWIDNGHVKPHIDSFLLLNGAVKLLDDGAPEALAALINEIDDVELVVYDTLSWMIAGHNENDNSDMSRFIEAAEFVREQTDATMLFVHHTGKGDQSTYRGATALKGNISTVLELASERDGEGRVISRQLKVNKQKDAQEAPPVNIKLSLFGGSLVSEEDK